METLYDMLGALPRDDSEGLRIAFRRAAKGTHPDLNPGDPDAGRKFREIVRAHDILIDGEQRAAYDHLLELARVEEIEHARAGKLHKLASWVMAVAGLSAVSVGGLALAAQLWTATETAADSDLIDTSPGLTNIATVSEAAPSEAAPAPIMPDETKGTELPPLGPPLDITPPATIEPDHPHSVDRASTEISHAKRPERIAHAATVRKRSLPPAESPARPTPPRWTAANDLSRQESFPFAQRP